MKSNDKEISAVLRVEGGIADEGLLEIYDASALLYGLARSLNIVGHAFANNEEVRSRANNAHGVQTLINSSRKGCFEEQIDIRFAPKVVSRMGHTVIAGNFWDYFEYAFSAATGKPYAPSSSHLKRIVSKDPEYQFVIGDALESALFKLHKPVEREKGVKIIFSRPRLGDIFELNRSTLDYISLREEKSNKFIIVGNVTRYNVLSDFGRLYSNEQNRVISFKLANPNDGELRGMVVQSMQDHVKGQSGKLYFTVTEVISSQGEVKRYIVHNISTHK